MVNIKDYSSEIIINLDPESRELQKITLWELQEIDTLARLMQDPDKNFNRLQQILNTNKRFRLLHGGLL